MIRGPRQTKSYPPIAQPATVPNMPRRQRSGYRIARQYPRRRRKASTAQEGGSGHDCRTEIVVQHGISRPTPWFWAINGPSGVLAASVAVGASIAFSINTSLWIGAACYLLLAPVSPVDQSLATLRPLLGWAAKARAIRWRWRRPSGACRRSGLRPFCSILTSLGFGAPTSRAPGMGERLDFQGILGIQVPPWRFRDSL